MYTLINLITSHFGTVMCVRYAENSYGPLEIFITRDECNELVSINYVTIAAAVVIAAALVACLIVINKRLKKG